MRKNILVIDDFAMNLRLVNEILSDKYEVHICKNGKKALCILQDTSIDLILLDLIMPEMSGTDILKIIKNIDIYKNIPVVIMTGRKDIETFKSAYSFGIADYIAKPFDKKTLLAKIENVFNNNHSGVSSIKLEELKHEIG